MKSEDVPGIECLADRDGEGAARRIVSGKGAKQRVDNSSGGNGGHAGGAGRVLYKLRRGAGRASTRAWLP